jgi:phosphodiesterase/alkaline phosphatase D-like protein
MRSHLRHARWTLTALVCAGSCQVSHDFDAGTAQPSAAGATRENAQASDSPRNAMLELEAARCLRYRRQQAHEVAPGPRSPNGRDATPQPSILNHAPPPPQTADAQLVVNTPHLTQGPLLGAVAADGVKVWIRADSPAAWDVQVWPSGESELSASALRLQGPPLTAASDFTATAQIVGLRPRSSYEYAVSLRVPAAASDEAPAARGTFHTLAPDGEPTRTRLVVGADITGSGPQPIFRQIADVNPDFVLLIGDQVYADAAEPTRDGYAYFYRRNWNIKYLRPMLQNVPAFMIWDDHEIEDNYWQGKSDRYAPAREAYELYVQAHNPAPYRSDVLYYTMRSGDVAFFVLDVRSNRSSNRLPDDEHKSMLGAQQKWDLVDWLTCETAKLKVIVSPVIWNDWATTGEDAWLAYTTEREELLGYIAAEGIGNVLLLSGDQHWSAVFRFLRDDYAFYEFLPTPLSKTRGTAPGVVTDEILARDDDNFAYGVVDIDTTREPTSIALTLCALDKPCRPGEERSPGTGVDLEGERENVPFTIHLTGRDLGRQGK